jgi:hypothetical protein
MIAGAKRWFLAGGHIPVESRGPEPACTSRDELSFLNATSRDAAVALTLFYSDRPPVGPYRIEIAAHRQRTVRVNDLVDPLPVPLGVDYGLVIVSSVPIVVQALRVDTTTGLSVTALPLWAAS